MSQITITLKDDDKIDELLALIATLPYVENARFHAVDETTNGAFGQAVAEANNAADDERSPFYLDPQTQIMDKEIAVFEAMQTVLLDQYLGQYVAIFHGKVVDHDADKVMLLDRLAQSHPYDVVLVRHVRRTPRPPFRLRSPRLNRN